MTDTDWDFYLCRVDDRPASIFTDLSRPARGADPTRDTLYAVFLDLAEPADHGMGSGDEAEVLFGIEDAVVAAAADEGFEYVGRIRGSDRWQLSFMAAADREPQLDLLVHPQASAAPRSYEIRSMPDPDWSYAFGMLQPDRERLQWILDRRVVENLAKHGDPLTEPRDVAHWIHFADPAQREACKARLTAAGFECSETDDSPDSARPHGLVAKRIDSVDLHEIHDLVMFLVGHADACEGTYDGWESQVRGD